MSIYGTTSVSPNETDVNRQTVANLLNEALTSIETGEVVPTQLLLLVIHRKPDGEECPMKWHYSLTNSEPITARWRGKDIDW